MSVLERCLRGSCRQGGVRGVLGWILAALLMTGSTAFAEAIEGFVTNIEPPMQFDLGKIRVELSGKTVCESGLIYGVGVGAGLSTSQPSAWYLVRPGGHSFRFSSIRTQRVPCDAVHLTVGARVDLAGTYTTADTFAASSLLDYSIQQADSLQGSGVLEEDPRREGLQKGAEPVWIDGYKLDLTLSTKFQSPRGEESSGRVSLRAGMQVTYAASHGSGGRLIVDSMQVAENQRAAYEGNFLKLFAGTITPPDYRRRVPGTIRFAHGAAVEIVADSTVQDFVSRLGMELVPEYQKQLPDGDSAKVPFRFLVVRSSSTGREPNFIAINGTLPHMDQDYGYDYGYAYSHSTERMKQVMALPTGLLLIPDVAIANLHNEAQLASLLSYGITAVLQKDVDDAWRTARSKSPQDKADLFAEFLSINEQVLRLGIRQTYLAGYDIREAPWAWDVALGRSAKNPVGGGPSKIIKPWYAAYAFDRISKDYADEDYSKLKRGDAEYAQFLGELRKADPEAFAGK